MSTLSRVFANQRMPLNWPYIPVGTTHLAWRNSVCCAKGRGQSRAPCLAICRRRPWLETDNSRCSSVWAIQSILDTHFKNEAYVDNTLARTDSGFRRVGSCYEKADHQHAMSTLSRVFANQRMPLNWPYVPVGTTHLNGTVFAVLKGEVSREHHVLQIADACPGLRQITHVVMNSVHFFIGWLVFPVDVQRYS